MLDFVTRINYNNSISNGRLYMAIADENTHRHKCRTCWYVWEHDDDCAGDKEEHTCSKCGDIQWWVYFGDDLANDYWNPYAKPSWLRKLWNFILPL